MAQTNLTGTLDIHDFRMTVTGVTFSVDKSQAIIAYKGVASPSATCDIITYDYSITNGATWVQMDDGSSVITGLPFVASPGYSGVITWEIKSDLGTLRYNTQIRLRLRAQSGLLITGYAYYSFMIERVQTDLFAQSSKPAFPDDYAGIAGGELMANAPKS